MKQLEPELTEAISKQMMEAGCSLKARIELLKLYQEGRCGP